MTLKNACTVGWETLQIFYYGWIPFYIFITTSTLYYHLLHWFSVPWELWVRTPLLRSLSVGTNSKCLCRTWCQICFHTLVTLGGVKTAPRMYCFSNSSFREWNNIPLSSKWLEPRGTQRKEWFLSQLQLDVHVGRQCVCMCFLCVDKGISRC